MTELRRNILIGLLLGVIALSLLGAAGSSRSVCSRCHSDESDTLRVSAHSRIGCYACHLSAGNWSLASAKVDEFTRMYPLAVLGRAPQGPAILTSRSACLDCHAGVMEAITEDTALKISHAACAGDGSCDECHSTVAHGSAARWASGPVMEDCIACHSDRNVSIECETCHTGRDRDRTSRSGPWQVTHGPNWQSTHGMGRLDSCVTCHPGDYCVRCHNVRVPHSQDFGGTHGAAVAKDRASCLVCHDEHDFCDSCHGMPMPHPSGFKQQHTSIATGTADHSCMRCHDDGDCQLCHDYHIHPGGARGVPVPWTLTDEDRR